MQTTRRRLRRVGLLLLNATILGSMIFPFFGPVGHTGMSAAERQRFDREQTNRDLNCIGVTGVGLGARLALIITSFAIRTPREP